jgi:hypothetical protein
MLQMANVWPRISVIDLARGRPLPSPVASWERAPSASRSTQRTRRRREREVEAQGCRPRHPAQQNLFETKIADAN